MPRPSDLRSRRLYIVDLAARLESMEASPEPIHPTAYRLYARRMAAAMADYPVAQLASEIAPAHPAVMHALVQRHFDLHGAFPGEAGKRARRATRALLAALRGWTDLRDPPR